MAIKSCILGGIKEKSIVATVVIDHLEHTFPLVETLLDGGIEAIEVTLRTEAALKAIAKISREFPGMLVGAGTVLTREQVFEVQGAGAKFAVAPGMNPEVVDTARDIGLAFAPGICTPSDIERAILHGCTVLKFFPAEGSGGIKYLNNMSEPYSHLGIRFIPLGGINENNFQIYLQQDSVVAVGGSWLAPRKVIAAKNWSYVRNSCYAVKLKLSEIERSVFTNLRVESVASKDALPQNIPIKSF